MKKVLWISRHQMTEEQFADLERVMNDNVKLDVYADSVKNVGELKEPVKNCDAVAAVLPSDLMAGLWKMTGDKMLLEAVSARIPTGRMTELSDGRREKEFAFKHIGWKQIVKYDVESRIF